jgi:hypothetical protein
MTEFDKLSLEWDARVTPAIAEAKRLLEGRGYRAELRFWRGAPTLLLVQMQVFRPGQTTEPYLLELWFGEAKVAGVDSEGYLSFAAISDANDKRLDRMPNKGNSAADCVCLNRESLLKQIDTWLAGGLLYQFVVTTLDHVNTAHMKPRGSQ